MSVLKDFRCPRGHGVFEAHVHRDAQMACCPRRDSDDEICNEPSPWSPSPVRFKVAISATRGGIDRPEHKDWDFTANLEEGQSPDEWEADRDAAAERRREQLVVDAVKEGL